tara:strand:+ start:187 stop:309 length:123 start_codon:yes stop_codon:yes gene_type:complete
MGNSSINDPIEPKAKQSSFGGGFSMGQQKPAEPKSSFGKF